MKILWITNFLFPAVCEALGLKSTFASGWTYSAAALISKYKDVDLAVASLGPVSKVEKFRIDNITYYVIPQIKENDRKYFAKLEKLWNLVYNDLEPNVVHIYGTEHPHSLAYIRSCKNSNIVISIQALIGPYSKYYNLGMSNGDILKNITCRDIVRGTLYSQKRNYEKRGKWEKECIQKVNYIEGRTNWDRAITWAFNSNVIYFQCFRILREPFYRNQVWSYSECEKHSIFLSQGHYPIKGIHQVFKALPIVLRKFPNAKIYVAGLNISTCKSVSEWLVYGGYGRYIHNLIKQNRLQERIEFLGPLNSEDIYRQYLSANVFICSSAIENAPNSIGEAQILGTPVIASYVGGNSDMVEHGKTGFLYRFEEVEMLADLICRVFEMQDCLEMSRNEIEDATKRHDRESNINQMLSMYQCIINQNNK